MKRIIFTLALIGVTMFSCQRPELSDVIDVPVGLAVHKSLSVSDAEWTPEDVKSTFADGVGITLSGTETISVFYAEGADPIVATPAGNGKYAFSHPEVAGIEEYDYNYLMPHASATKADGTARLFAVQYPGAGTFDPSYDFLLGKPSLNVPKSTSEVEVSKFKRLSAPFNFVIDDEYQLLKREAIKVVTVDFSGSAEPVAADFVAAFSSDYASAGISGTVAGTGSTALTAVYPEGLPFENNLYNVWFSSLPVELKAGQVVSLTVSTATMTLTCKATIPSDFALGNDKLNQIPFKLSVYKTDYANIKSQTTVYASGTALASNSGILAVPAVTGYRNSVIKVYANAESFASVTTSAELVVKSGEIEVARKNFNLADAAGMNGGYVEFDNLDSYSDLTISFVTGDSSTEHAAVISAITTLLVEADEPEFAFPGEFPIIAWEDIPVEKSAERFPSMKAAGINIYLGIYEDLQTVMRVLDIAESAGVKLIVQCPELLTSPETTVKDLMDHPALYGYHVEDEPEVKDFAKWGQIVEAIQSIDSEHICYINLYPNWAWGRLERYESNVNAYLEAVPVKMLSFDNYPVVSIDGAPNSLRYDWYHNLEVILAASKAKSIPFWAFARANSKEGWIYEGQTITYPIPTTQELRAQMFTNLAYGAQGLQYFTYWGIETNSGKTRVYERVQTVNTDIHALSKVFLGCKVISVCHTGELPVGTKALEHLPSVFSQFETSSGAVVSHIENGDKYYLVVVNRSISQPMTLTISVDPSVHRVLKTGRTETVDNQSYTILEGDMEIFTWNKGWNDGSIYDKDDNWNDLPTL